MKGSRVAKRYARALLGLSEDRGQLETWGAELERLARIADAPEIAFRLASPEVSREARIEAMAKIAERLDLSYPLRSLAVVVARHGRIADLIAVSQSYQDQLDVLLGRARATLTFARAPLDQALLGGVVAELEGKIYDGSLATRLSEAERRLAG